MAFIIVTANSKGGSGKSTLSFNTAAALKSSNPEARVALVDADFQVTSSTGACITNFAPLDHQEQINVLQTVLERNGRSISDATFVVPQLSGVELLPSSPLLHEWFHGNASYASDAFARALGEARSQFDFIIVDTNPGVTESLSRPGHSSLTEAALQQADVMLLAEQPSGLNLKGTDRICRVLAAQQSRRQELISDGVDCGPPTQVLVVPTFFERDASSDRDYLGILTDWAQQAGYDISEPMPHSRHQKACMSAGIPVLSRKDLPIAQFYFRLADRLCKQAQEIQEIVA